MSLLVGVVDRLLLGSRLITSPIEELEPLGHERVPHHAATAVPRARY